MRSQIETYRNHYNKLKIEQDLLLQQKDDLEYKIGNLEESLDLYKKARFVLAEVVRNTQEFFKKEVESLVNYFLASIFTDEGYIFTMNFEIKRNKSECLLLLETRNGEPVIPKFSVGGGVLDVLSTALKIVFWSLQKPKTRATMIFDEPGKFLGKLQLIFIQVLKELSNKIPLQFIFISHDESIIEEADKVFYVEQINGISHVTESGFYQTTETSKREE